MDEHSEQYNLYLTEIIKAKVQSIRDRINSGEISFLYQSIYLPVDSIVVKEKTIQEFSIKAIRPLGFDGWDIVGIVPKTLGVGLENSSIGSTMGTTWGAGIGGNIVGVYVLLKKEVSAIRNVSDNFLEKHVSENIFDFATESEAQILSGLLSKKTEEIISFASNALEKFIVIVNSMELNGDPAEYYKNAELLMEKNEFDEAILEYIKVIRVAPPQDKWSVSAQKGLKTMGFSEADIRHI